MSTPAPSIWQAAVADAIGRPASTPAITPSAPGTPAATSDVWGAAVNDALGKKPPAQPTTPPAVPSGESADFWRGSPSIPGQAMLEAQTMTPEKMKQGAVTAAKTGVAGAVAGSAALGAAGVLAPTVATETVGSGILDASGQEILREVAKAGPSLGRQVLTAAGQWIAANPGKAAVAYTLARHLGIPLPNIFKWLASE